MHFFDKVEQKTLDRRHWQLWMLSLGMIFVLGAGTALLMYPAVFGANAGPGGRTTRTLFFGFCALCVLMVAYLLDRQYVVSKLRQDLVAQKAQIARLRQEASADLLGILPGFSHFQDRLTMGFRRAAQAGEPLSLVLVRVKLSHAVDSPPEISIALRDAARVLIHKLRTDDSLYLLSSSVFGVVLPNTCRADMNRVVDRVAEGLIDASGASNRFAFDMQVVNYPEQASTAYEMERIANTFSLDKGAAPGKAAGASEPLYPEPPSSGTDA
jgi:GGDEF domain-containing protein